MRSLLGKEVTRIWLVTSLLGMVAATCHAQGDATDKASKEKGEQPECIGVYRHSLHVDSHWAEEWSICRVIVLRREERETKAYLFENTSKDELELKWPNKVRLGQDRLHMFERGREWGCGWEAGTRTVTLPDGTRLRNLLNMQDGAMEWDDGYVLDKLRHSAQYAYLLTPHKDQVSFEAARKANQPKEPCEMAKRLAGCKYHFRKRLLSIIFSLEEERLIVHHVTHGSGFPIRGIKKMPADLKAAETSGMWLVNRMRLNGETMALQCGADKPVLPVSKISFIKTRKTKDGQLEVLRTDAYR